MNQLKQQQKKKKKNKNVLQSLNSHSKYQCHILFLNAITDCDTTSVFDQIIKIKVFQLFEEYYDLVTI